MHDATSNDTSPRSKSKKDPDEAWKHGISSDIIKRCIEAMSRNIDDMNRKSVQFYQKIMMKRVTEEIREEELNKIIEVLR